MCNFVDVERGNANAPAVVRPKPILGKGMRCKPCCLCDWARSLGSEHDVAEGGGLGCKPPAPLLLPTIAAAPGEEISRLLEPRLLLVRGGGAGEKSMRRVARWMRRRMTERQGAAEEKREEQGMPRWRSRGRRRW